MKKRAAKERCYAVPDGHGGTIQVRAARPPSAGLQEALRNLNEAARRVLGKGLEGHSVSARQPCDGDPA